jgi:chemotaxis protein methyltransferase WspC
VIALADFERLVEDTAGLDAASIGSSTIERGVRERLQALGVDEMQEYWLHVSQSERELQWLIEAIVVHETWFFRDAPAFAALQRIVHSDWPPSSPDGVVNVLSLPCSTGEEPYSIAMALLDAGLPAPRFRVLGVDISERSVAHARLGSYGRGAFRSQDLTFRDRYFAADGRGHVIADRVQRQVRFQQGNLFADSFCSAFDRFDIVFCRNLLIYFDQATQERAVARLTQLMAPHGVLFVGSAETGVLLNHPALSAQLPRAYAFRNTSPGTAPAARANRLSHHIAARKSVAVPPHAVHRAPRIAAPVPIPSTVTAHAQDAGREPLDRLAEAQRFADEGRFAEAAACCDEQLRLKGPSAQGFHLLGLVRDASGDWLSAADCYRKALYLDPAHTEALIHLALLLEQHGRQSEARLLRDRLRRLNPKATS